MKDKEDRVESLHEKLSDASITFVKKLKLAVNEGELDYWWERDNPPNETPDIFKKFRCCQILCVN